MILARIIRIVVIFVAVLSLCLSYFGYVVGSAIGLGVTGLIVCAGGPLLGVVGATVLLRLRPQMQANILLLLFSSFVGVYGIEAALTILAPPATASKQDSSTQIELVREMRLKGTSATINVNVISFVKAMNEQTLNRAILPLAGVANAQVVLCNEVGEWVVFDSDAHGFNNPQDLYQRGSADIAIVGDSFAQGHCTKTGESIAGRIRDVYPRTINLGLGGTGPLAHLATFREYIEAIRPKVVLWFFFEGNDYANLAREKKSDLRKYLNPAFSQDLLERKDKVQEVVQNYADRKVAALIEQPVSKSTSVLWDMRKHSVLKFLTLYQTLGRLGLFPVGRWENLAHNSPKSDDFNMLHQVLKLARDKTMSWGGEFYFVYIVVKGNFSRFGKPPAHRDVTLEMVRSLGISVIDTLEPLGAHANPLDLFQGHFTPLGNSIVAESILGRLDQP